MQKLEIYLELNKNEREKKMTKEEFYTVHQTSFLVFF